MVGFFGYWFAKRSRRFAQVDCSSWIFYHFVWFCFFRTTYPLINAITADISDKLNLEGGENISGTVFSYLTTLI
jgi:hypothetical protein